MIFGYPHRIQTIKYVFQVSTHRNGSLSYWLKHVFEGSRKTAPPPQEIFDNLENRK